MLSYWQFLDYSIGPITLQVWGTFVALGIIAAILISYQKAKKDGLEAGKVLDFAFWIVLAGFIGARFGHAFFYEPTYFLAHPVEILKFWQGGFSSYGGFIGAVAAFFTLPTTHHLPPTRKIQWADTLVFGLPFGWAIGRLGCFFVHDHPGKFTNFFLGVQYPDGVRYDLGLYDVINAALLALAVFLFRNKLKKYPGATVVLVCFWYGLTRFFLDFLRASDSSLAETRYFGLTPGQYGSVILIIFAVWLSFKIKNKNLRLK